MNEQITKTFEHLLNLCYKYHSIDRLISLPRKSRIVYRINQEKLDKYRSQNNSKYDNQTNISTQTTFNTDLIHPSVNTLSIISKETNEIDISNNLSSISSSLSNINKTTTKNSNSSSTEVDSSDKSSSEISMKTDSNQIRKYKFNDYSSQPQSTNRRVYIRSIVRHMLSDDTSDKQQYINRNHHRIIDKY